MRSRPTVLTLHWTRVGSLDVGEDNPHLAASEDHLSKLNFDERAQTKAVLSNPILNYPDFSPFQVSALKFLLSAFYCLSLWYGSQIRLVCFIFFSSQSDVILHTMTCPDTHANLMFQPWVDAVIEAETIYQTPLLDPSQWPLLSQCWLRTSYNHIILISALTQPALKRIWKAFFIRLLCFFLTRGSPAVSVSISSLLFIT